MSRRSSQGMLYTVTVLLAGNVILGVAAYWHWQQKVRAEARAAQATVERDEAKRDQQAASERLRNLRGKVSAQTAMGFDELMAAIDKDLREFGTGAENESYADVVRRLHTLVETHRIELKQLMADKDRLQREYEAVQRSAQSAVQVAETAGQEAREELIAEKAEIDRMLAGKDSEIARILDRANTLAARLETEKRDKERTREELLTQVNKLRTILSEARAPYTPSALAKQKADGKVIKVSAATRTAWLNIGNRHGVVPELTFSVQPAGFTGNPFTRPKAKLEIARVHGADLSEARILDGSINNPVLEGDEIFNPAWNPGHRMRFALAGSFDIDQDGSDDRTRVRQLIKLAGAEIDAEILPDGTEQGEVTVETSFFVRGQRPDPERGGLVENRVLAAMAKMERTALDYGAVVIDVDKFLDLMGYTPLNRVEHSSMPPRPGPRYENPNTRVARPGADQ